MAVTAAPAAEVEAGVESIATAPLETRDLDAAECHLACKAGTSAVKKICGRLPLKVKAACIGAAAAAATPLGLEACTYFCDEFF